MAGTSILVKIVTKQRRCWRLVKTGHEDLILTTSLQARGHFRTQGEIRQIEAANTKE